MKGCRPKSKAFPIYVNPEDAECFNGHGKLNMVTLEKSGYPKGKFKALCPHCGAWTFFDVLNSRMRHFSPCICATTRRACYENRRAMEYLGWTIYYGHVNMAYYAEQRGVVPIREYGYSTQQKAINAVKRRIKRALP